MWVLWISLRCLILIELVRGHPLVFRMAQVSDLETVSNLQIVTRAEWKARPPKETTPLKVPVPFAVVHHTDGPSCFSETQCSAVVRGIQNFHMDERHWSDIGYNFLVGEDGRVYEGRGWDTLGAHAKGFNTQSIGISVMGTYNSKPPNQLALTALQDLISLGVERGKIAPAYTLVGHRQTNHVGYTECPGDAFMCVIMKWPHWKPYQKIGKFVYPKC